MAPDNDRIDNTDLQEGAEEITAPSAGPQLPRNAIVEALKTIEDPELFLDIWFLGLIYSIDIGSDKVAIDMTFTSAMFPAGPWLVDQVRSKVTALSGALPVEVKVVFSPPWEPSEEVKAMLGML